MPKVDADTLYGSLRLLILHVLAAGPRHGLAISREIGERARDELKIEEGALYPALHRLERDGLLRSSWGISDTRRRVKTYELTARGRRRLAAETRRWLRHTAAVAAVLDRSPDWTS